VTEPTTVWTKRPNVVQRGKYVKTPSEVYAYEYVNSFNTASSHFRGKEWFNTHFY